MSSAAQQQKPARSNEDLWQFYSVAKDQMARQHESLGRLHTKVSTIMGFGFVLIGLVLNILSDIRCVWLALAPLVPLFVGQLILIGGYRVKSYANAPNIDLVRWHKDETEGSVHDLLSEAIDEMAKCFGDVEGEMRTMKRRINWSTWLMFIGATITAVVLLL